MKKKLCIFTVINIFIAFLTIFYLFITVYHYHEAGKISLYFCENNIMYITPLDSGFFLNLAVILNVLLPISILNNVAFVIWIIFTKKMNYTNVFILVFFIFLFVFAFILGVDGEKYNVAMQNKNLKLNSMTTLEIDQTKQFKHYIFWLR